MISKNEKVEEKEKKPAKVAKQKMATMDGNEAAAYISYAFTEVASIYPITPSSDMAEHVDEWSALDRKNIWGETVDVVEMQSEAGAAGTVHGSLTAGALTTTYTASQGLLLMIPNMYKIAGEFLPGVMHVAARSLATHALSIFGDHSDVMACGQTGWAMLASESVQEIMDLGAIAHLAAIESKIPFLHFFDGFRTSHEQQKIYVNEYEDIAKLVNQKTVKEFKDNALSPNHPVVRGTNQNPDVFFQAREAGNPFYDKLPAIIKKYMDKIGEQTGRKYKPFDYYGDPNAENIIISMGSINETVEQTVDYLNSKGEKVGLVRVRLYRPFVPEFLLEAIPKTVKRIAVLDRIKSPGAQNEPLHRDVCSVFYGKKNAPLIVGGHYGLSSKDTVPADIIGVFNNLKEQDPKNHFTISIVDDVTHHSLEAGETVNLLPESTIQCKFFGLGSDGTVGANKQAVGIIGDIENMYAQAYFSYDSKKSGGITISHLRFGKDPINAPYLITNADFVSCSNQSYVNAYDLLEGLKPGGTFLLNCVWRPDQVNQHIPAHMKRYMAKNKIKFYTINAVDIAKEIGLGNRTNMIMQAAFFKLANVIPIDDAVKALKVSIKNTYGRKGDEIVEMNYKAVDAGLESLMKFEVPEEWARIEDEDDENYVKNQEKAANEPPFIKDVLRKMNSNKGDNLPVSTFTDYVDGSFPLGTSAYEKRGVSSFVPIWEPENCIQCNQCSFVCPHASIRPFLLTPEEVAEAPKNMILLDGIGSGLSEYKYRLQVSVLDCQGCGSCVITCPAKKKALKMEHIDNHKKQGVEFWDFLIGLESKDGVVPASNVKNTQFKQPLLEFSGACAGCGETPYAKLITQLYGDRMMIANATGCSSIWGAAAPAMPFCTNKEGRGPAWSNSLFEDNAEFGFGMLLATNKERRILNRKIRKLSTHDGIGRNFKEALTNWIENRNSGETSKSATRKLLPFLEEYDHPEAKEILAQKDDLVKKSIWAFGGDGWAYDIGFGGLDHVIASGKDINIFVYDTEVYSNTGGQSSKATPTAAIAKFAADGKRTSKKNLAMMAISYGYVYVAQIAMGANMNQTLKAIKEAEAYPGPSLIIAYSPCINHGIKGGLGNAMPQMKKAVECGYWHLFRYNPSLKKENRNPFILDSKEPTGDFQAFIKSENRYAALNKLFPEDAEELFQKTEEDAKRRYNFYINLRDNEIYV